MNRSFIGLPIVGQPGQPNQILNQRKISPENETAWVPFPGSKRKADDFDIYLNREYGPSPAKQAAVDESVANDVLTPNGLYIRTESEMKGNCAPKLTDDQEMQDLTDFNLTDSISGAHQYLNEVQGGGGNLHVKDDFKLHETSSGKSNGSCMENIDLKGFPKLYVFDGLLDQMSEKQNGDSPLPSSLVNQLRRESAMSMVLWKPLHSETSAFVQETSTCARTRTARPRPNAQRSNKDFQYNPNDEEKEEMDLSV